MGVCQMFRALLIAAAITAATIGVAPAASGEPPYYPNCAAACEAGAAPLYKGDPGYRGPLDRDGDGIACEVCP